MLEDQELILWKAALPHLKGVRNNDEHTLHSLIMAKKLLEKYPEADSDIVRCAIIFHDVGWSKIDPEKVLQAFGPNNKYPELQRQHELESVAITQKALKSLGWTEDKIRAVCAIIDGHDTTKDARSLNDMLVKDADKLWRYTEHGNQTIGVWFQIERAEVLQILEDFVLPKLLSTHAKWLACSLLNNAKMFNQMHQYL